MCRSIHHRYPRLEFIRFVIFEFLSYFKNSASVLFMANSENDFEDFRNLNLKKYFQKDVATQSEDDSADIQTKSITSTRVNNSNNFAVMPLVMPLKVLSYMELLKIDNTRIYFPTREEASDDCDVTWDWDSPKSDKNLMGKKTQKHNDSESLFGDDSADEELLLYSQEVEMFSAPY